MTESATENDAGEGASDDAEVTSKFSAPEDKALLDAVAERCDSRHNALIIANNPEKVGHERVLERRRKQLGSAGERREVLVESRSENFGHL